MQPPQSRQRPVQVDLQALVHDGGQLGDPRGDLAHATSFARGQGIQARACREYGGWRPVCRIRATDRLPPRPFPKGPPLAAPADDALADPAEVARPWLDGYPPGVPPTYRYPQVPLTRFLDDAIRDFPEHAAVESHGTTWTYDHLGREVDAVAAGLVEAGIRPGERVALALPNVPQTVALAFGVWRAGAVLVPLEPSLTTVELVRLLEDADAAALVGTGDLLRRLAADGASRTTRLTVGIERDVWAPRAGRVRRAVRRTRAPHLPPRTIDLAELLRPAAAVPRHPVQPDDLAVLAYTAATTGGRRAAMLTHRNLVANAFQARLWIPDVQAGRERVLAAMPFGHVHGLTLGLLAGVLSAATLVLVDEPDGETLVATIEQARPTLFPTVPNLLRRIAEHPKVGRHDLTSLRACVSGGAALEPGLAQRIQELTGGARVRQGYGLSEASPLTHANPIYGRVAHEGIGLPVSDTVAVVVDPVTRGRILPPGQVGELAVAGPQVMAGYWKDPALTAATLRGPWLFTGDLATVDDEGWFTFVERKSDVLDVDGQMVFPHDLEAALLHHPDVQQAAAVATPAGGVRVFVVTRRRARASVDQLREHCLAYLSDPSATVDVEVVDALPTNAMGKLLRQELRQREAAS